jgi:hypothetical protein
MVSAAAMAKAARMSLVVSFMVFTSSASGQKVNGAVCDIALTGCELTRNDYTLNLDNALNIRMVVHGKCGKLKTVTVAALAVSGDREISEFVVHLVFHGLAPVWLLMALL